MKNLFIIAVYLLQTVFSAPAQTPVPEFGGIYADELMMKEYSRDKLAEALVIYDVGDARFYDSDNGFDLLFERRTRIKIFTNAGLKYGEIEIPYYVENLELERILEIEGFTYNIENGQIRKTKLNLEQSFDEKINDHWMVKKFAMPDVKEGSIIEYRYKIQSPYLFNLRDWDFQRRIPTVYSEYTTRMIPFYEYTYFFQGASKFDVFRNAPDNMKRRYGSIEYTDNVYTFGMRNLPAFRDESFITSINDYIMKIDFQLAKIHYPNGAVVEIMTTWPMLIKELKKHSDFGLYIKSASRNAPEILPAIDLDATTNLEKAKRICQYVKLNYNWNGYNDKFASQNVKDFLKTKTGNSADINLFLCTLLNAGGVEAYPVLVSTRNHGKIPLDYPFQQFFNYVLVLVKNGEQQILLDATMPLAPFGMLPARCINEKGLIVNEEKVGWAGLADGSSAVITDTIHIKLNPEVDSASIAIRVVAEGHSALEKRQEFHSDAEKFARDLTAEGIELNGELTVKNEKEPDLPFMYQYQLQIATETVGDNILITPFPGLALAENPLKLSYRAYPVDMIYPQSSSFTTLIDVPEGYQLVKTDNSVDADNALVQIHYQVTDEHGKVRVDGTYRFKKAVYQNHEYYDLRKFFSEIVDVFNKKIVLAKNA
ncbi:MAG: DUF3857 domain-containing protein [Bacteroidales bacterium]|nr:DUF3857 domain-containing protein [Bacteroidales bacterium]